MIGRAVRLPVVCGLLVAAAAAAPARADDDEAQRWIERMGRALNTLDYEGVFVYVHDGRIEAMQVTRTLEAGGPRERLVSLTGDRRELVREGADVRCTLAGGALSVTDVVRSPWSAGDAAALAAARDRYRLRLTGTDRVAGHDAVVLEAQPSDAQRFGYRLWLDAQTGMLLGSTLLDSDGEPIEQLMFTELAMRAAAHPLAADAEDGSGSRVAPATPEGIRVVGLPDGFSLLADASEPGSARRHLLFSDGLASVSVYVEPTEPDAAPARGLMRRGAVSVFGHTQEGWRIVVVGDLPAATIERVARSTELVATK